MLRWWAIGVALVVGLSASSNGAQFIFKVPQGGGATPAWRQSGYGECQPADTCVVDFGPPAGNSELNVLEGSLLVLTDRTDNNTGITMSSVTSTPSGCTWVEGGTETGVTDINLHIWYCANAPAGNTNVTVTHNGGVSDFQMRLVLDEYTGVALTSPVEAVVTAAPGGNPACANPGTITTSGTNRLIHVGAAADGNDNADTFTAGSGYTIHDLGGDPSGSDKTMTQHRVAATAGGYNTEMCNINDSNVSVAIAFKPGN